MSIRLFDELFAPHLDLDEPRQTRGYCPYCEQNVEAELRDCGIGWTEYWGSHARHVDMRLLCKVCDTDVMAPHPESDDFELED